MLDTESELQKGLMVDLKDSAIITHYSSANRSVTTVQGIVSGFVGPQRLQPSSSPRRKITAATMIMAIFPLILQHRLVCKASGVT